MGMPVLKREFRLSFAEALERVPQALKTEGFGVLTEIDVQETLKRKLDADFRRYRILGACNPTLALRALSIDLDVGTLLPCNVVVDEQGEGTTVVATVDPQAAIGRFGEAGLADLAAEVREKLARVLERVE